MEFGQPAQIEPAPRLCSPATYRVTLAAGMKQRTTAPGIYRYKIETSGITAS
jgi:hypothetical protein